MIVEGLVYMENRKLLRGERGTGAGENETLFSHERGRLRKVGSVCPARCSRRSMSKTEAWMSRLSRRAMLMSRNTYRLEVRRVGVL